MGLGVVRFGVVWIGRAKGRGGIWSGKVENGGANGIGKARSGRLG